MIKRDFPGTKLIIMGGKEAPYVSSLKQSRVLTGNEV